MCDECRLLNLKREFAYIQRVRLENQLLSAGFNSDTTIADQYAKSLTECDVLYTAYRAHQKFRHGVEVGYVAAIGAGL